MTLVPNRHYFCKRSWKAISEAGSLVDGLEPNWYDMTVMLQKKRIGAVSNMHCAAAEVIQAAMIWRLQRGHGWLWMS